MASGCIIRPAQPADLFVLQSIEDDAGRAFEAVGYGDILDGPGRSPADAARAMDEAILLIAEGDDGPIGFAMVWLVDARPHLAELSVCLDEQGRGIGRELVSAAEAWARATGHTDMTLTTFVFVPWNAPWYARLGFEAFTPRADRPELAAICAHEASDPLGRFGRTAMRKRL